MVTIVLCMTPSVSAQRFAVAKEVSPDMVLTIDKGVIRQDGKLLHAGQVREVIAGNRDALQQYNSGTVLNLVGTIVMIPSAIPLGTGLGLLLGAYMSGSVNDDNRAGIHMGSGILIGIGAVGVGTGFLIASSGQKKIKNSVLLHNSNLKKDVSWRVDFGITSTGGAGLTLRF